MSTIHMIDLRDRCLPQKATNDGPTNSVSGMDRTSASNMMTGINIWATVKFEIIKKPVSQRKNECEIR